jgi:hypothetical protein
MTAHKGRVLLTVGLHRRDIGKTDKATWLNMSGNAVGTCISAESTYSDQMRSAASVDLNLVQLRIKEHWNQKAHPFKWTTKSATKIMAIPEPFKEAA